MSEPEPAEATDPWLVVMQALERRKHNQALPTFFEAHELIEAYDLDFSPQYVTSVLERDISPSGTTVEPWSDNPTRSTTWILREDTTDD